MPLKEGVRGSTCTLLDGHIMLDVGPTACYRMAQEKINPAAITDVVLTHSHDDHFNLKCLEEIANAPDRLERLRIYASPEAVHAVRSLPIIGVCMDYGRTFHISEYSFTALPAQHYLPNGEKAFHYLLTMPDGRLLLYALDGGWMAGMVRELLMFRPSDRQRPLDMIIWDATSGTSRNNWRFTDHNDLFMIRYMCQALGQVGIVSEKTRHILTHVARTLWPKTDEERQMAAREANAVLAEDGMKITFNR